MFPPSAQDVADGFIHLSSLEQTGATIRKYFRGQAQLVMLTIDSDKLIGEVRSEKSGTGRRGDFPHLYGQLPVSAIIEAMPFDAPE
jgi:uncharacterized protein (DUF952 family)